MKKIILMILFISPNIFAHEHHHHDEELMADKPAISSESSLYQLNSEWTDREGKKIKLQALAGEPRLVAMLYTRCQTACPLLVDSLQKILAKLPDKARNMPVTLFSFDSELESPATMQDFFKKRKLGSNWMVLKGSKDAVAELAGALGVRYKKLANGEYIHSSIIFLLDGKGNLVAQREGLNTSPADLMSAIRKAKGLPETQLKK